MPEVVFYALGGRSVEQKRALIKDFTDAVVKNYKVDPSAVTITIVEFLQGGQGEGRRPVQRHGAREDLKLFRARPFRCSRADGRRNGYLIRTFPELVGYFSIATPGRSAI